MIKLFVIADDFTGALDTGVHFASDGASTCVTAYTDLERAGCQEGLEILVVNAETRHLTPQNAYDRVRSLVLWAVKRNVEYIYKKTDSALRGHVGAELTAALDASGRNSIHFTPAFPEMRRTTVHGVQYIDGIPVAESVLGQDPFNPVRQSDISGILREETDVPITLVPIGGVVESKNGIIVYDAETVSDLNNLCELLIQDPDARLLAGCAGFASALSKRLFIQGMAKREKPDCKQLIVACGSINSVSLSQCAGAERLGVPRFYTNLMNTEKEDELFRVCGEEPVTILDTSLDNGSDNPAQLLGEIVRSLLDRRIENTLFVVGGDSMWAVLRQLEVTMLTPLWEVLPGVVISRYEYKGKKRYLLSKSGAFGGNQLFFDVYNRLTV